MIDLCELRTPDHPASTRCCFKFWCADHLIRHNAEKHSFPLSCACRDPGVPKMHNGEKFLDEKGVDHSPTKCVPYPGFTPGLKDDFGKTRFDLLPWRALEEVAKVLTKGAEKYAPENWRQVAGWRWRYFRAAIGHVAKWRMGEKLDPEWGLPHLAHAACCILFMIELDT